MLSPYAQETIVWIQSGPPAPFGEPGPTTEVSVKARVRKGARTRTLKTGEQIACLGDIRMPQEPSYTDGLRIDGTVYSVAGKEPVTRGISGTVIDHWLVYYK